MIQPLFENITGQPHDVSIVESVQGVCYLLSGFNLWLPILVHGVADSVELILMSRGADQPLRELIWKRPVVTHM